MSNYFTDMDISLIKQYVNASPSSLEHIMAMLEYRDLRTEQAYYAMLAYIYDHNKFGRNVPKEVKNAGEWDRSYWKERIIALDNNRRSKHNRALASFYDFVQIGRVNNLDYIYVGDILLPKEAFRYERPEVRTQMTNAMLELLKSIEDSVQVGIEQNEQLKRIKTDMNSFNRSYKVSKSLTDDESEKKDGGIEFELKSIIDVNNTNL